MSGWVSRGEVCVCACVYVLLPPAFVFRMSWHPSSAFTFFYFTLLQLKKISIGGFRIETGSRKPYSTHSHRGGGHHWEKEKKKESRDKSMGTSSIMATLAHSRVQRVQVSITLLSLSLCQIIHAHCTLPSSHSQLHSSTHTCFLVLRWNPQTILPSVLSSPFGGSITYFSIVHIHRDSRQIFTSNTNNTGLSMSMFYRHPSRRSRVSSLLSCHSPPYLFCLLLVTLYKIMAHFFGSAAFWPSIPHTTPLPHYYYATRKRTKKKYF